MQDIICLAQCFMFEIIRMFCGTVMTLSPDRV